MPNPKRNVGRKKETSISLEGRSDGSQKEYIKVFTKENAEFQPYNELIHGLLQKFVRWQVIFLEEQYMFSRHLLHSTPMLSGDPLYSEDYKSRFEVLQTSEGLIIGAVRGDPDQGKRPERVLHAEMRYDHILTHKPLDGELIHPTGTTVVTMEFTHGLMGDNPFVDLYKEPVGEHPFVDPDGKPLKKAHIEVNSFWGNTWREVRLYTVFPSKWNRTNKEQDKSHDVKYTFKDSTLEISKLFSYDENSVLMSDTFATTLVDSLDALIPNTSKGTGQNGPSLRQETQIPKKLSTRRRKP